MAVFSPLSNSTKVSTAQRRSRSSSRVTTTPGRSSKACSKCMGLPWSRTLTPCFRNLPVSVGSSNAPNWMTTPLFILSPRVGRPQVLSVVRLPFGESLDHGFQILAVLLVGGLRSRFAGVFQSVLIITDRHVPARQADVHRPRSTIALGIELEDLQGLLILLRGKQPAAIQMQLQRRRGRQVQGVLHDGLSFCIPAYLLKT